MSAVLIFNHDVAEFVHPPSLAILNSYRRNRRLNHSGSFDRVSWPKLREVVNGSAPSTFLGHDKDVALAHLCGVSRRAIQRELFDFRPWHQSPRRQPE